MASGNNSTKIVVQKLFDLGLMKLYIKGNRTNMEYPLSNPVLDPNGFIKRNKKKRLRIRHSLEEFRSSKIDIVVKVRAMAKINRA